MCRLLGVVSRAPAPLTETLSEDLGPFAALSSVHCDGWGLAHWNHDDDLVVAKSPEAALDSAQFRTATAAADTDAAILHLRKASAGMAPTASNTHPFAAGSVAFAHNGFFTPVESVEAEVRARGGRAPEGDTDSERYFGLVLATMRDLSPVDALQASAKQIAATSDQLVSLNALLLTQQALYAFAFWDETVPRVPEAGTATYELMFRVGPSAVTVASDGWEPLGARWERISNGTVLEVRRHDLRVTVHRS